MVTTRCARRSRSSRARGDVGNLKECQMNWCTDKKDMLQLICDETIAGPEQSRGPLCEFWKRACQEIAARYADGAFQIIYCELWLDSERIIVYPCDRAPVKGKQVHQRNERVCLQVLFPWLTSRFDNLPDPDAQPKEFEIAEKELTKIVERLLVESACQPEVVEELNALQKKSAFRICVSDSGELFELRWGLGKPGIVKWKDAKKKDLTPEERPSRCSAVLPTLTASP